MPRYRYSALFIGKVTTLLIETTINSNDFYISRSCHAHPPGRKQFIVRTGKDVTVLELWAGGRLACEVEVPKALHGAVFNDNWFGTGAAWTADENRIAYVAEVQHFILSQCAESSGRRVI